MPSTIQDRNICNSIRYYDMEQAMVIPIHCNYSASVHENDTQTIHIIKYLFDTICRHLQQCRNMDISFHSKERLVRWIMKCMHNQQQLIIQIVTVSKCHKFAYASATMEDDGLLIPLNVIYYWSRVQYETIFTQYSTRVNPYILNAYVYLWTENQNYSSMQPKIDMQSLNFSMPQKYFRSSLCYEHISQYILLSLSFPPFWFEELKV